MTSGRTWWWIRHAPVAGPARLCINGQNDPDCDLSDEDALQACADCLPAAATWFATGLARTLQTATALQAVVGGTLELESSPSLMEQDFGDWEGQRWSDLAKQDDFDFWNDPIGTAPPGGESYAEMASRVQSGIAELARRLPKGDLIVVAHAGPIRAAVAQAKPVSLGESLTLEVDPLSVTRIRETGEADGWQVIGINEDPRTLNQG